MDDDAQNVKDSIINIFGVIENIICVILSDKTVDACAQLGFKDRLMNFTEHYVALGRRVAAARRGLGLSQEALGARAHASRATIASIEAGRQKVALDQLYALAAALEITNISQLVPLEVPDLSALDVPTGFDLNPVQASQISDLVRSALASARGGARRRA